MNSLEFSIIRTLNIHSLNFMSVIEKLEIQSWRNQRQGLQSKFYQSFNYFLVNKKEKN